ncbi:probable helicase senataxin isoform X1 [Xenopus laevis]|uniref:Probable helicase senataxin isoform X1 n=1 Tax=Xenopus laevis TaxID=8355 RepID=A0A8J0T9Z8_XENLA|nr:probable helicase senataxin isoform X1 [Xenopus laevis]XP_018085036.1 probable helicase senataxin isoform X1 [Xenopus laevis]XP_018085037.1 probable helicase senataxin isoform X1 [Xenopus laevis]
MSTCRWCTPGGALTTELLKKYATKELPNEDIVGANEDLCYCMQCVGEYHRVRDEVPLLHKALWQMETARLIIQLEKSMQEEIEEDDELFLVEEDGEKQLFGYTGPNFESNLRVPLLEILKYPYLLLNKHVTELCTEALCKMEHANNPFQVYEKLPGVYLLLVHPNEAVRRWAIMTARTQGKVDRDDYYDLKEVFTCLFKVIELGLFENPDIYGNSEVEEGKLILLPSHLYDISNYKNYWLGICMLLTVLEEQAMDSLLLSHDKQNDFMQSILHVMEKNTEDENANPFWPALHCFMIILDRLGSKVWGQLIDPIQAFQTIISSPSYTSEIETIRNSYSRPTKMEPHNDDNDLDISCSQMVYSFKTEKPNKDTGWKKAISPDYCPNMYEEMQSLANVLQSEIGQDMRVHDSTFLWFLPYVQSVMDLKDLGVPYIIEVIHHLYFEIKDVLNQRVQQCDKVTELFVLVLVSIIELHRNKKCLYLLWVSCHKWVEALVRCSLLPVKDVQAKSNSKMAYGITCSPTQSSSSVQHSCLQLIRSILREGCQLGQQTTCMQYLDKLNLVLRGNMSRTLELNSNEVRDLQACLRQIVKIIKDKASAAPSSTLEQNTNRIEFVPFIKSESVDDDEYWDRACSSLEKPSPATSPTEGFDGACWLTVKREPEEDKCSESELNYCKPTSSTVAVGIKKESIIQSEPAPPALTGEQQNRKPKQNLSELKSKLSKVLQKSSFKRQNSLPENINQKDEVEKQVPLESSEKCIPSTKPVKSEPHDSLFKPPSCNSSYSCSSSNIAVTKQLQRLSLENRDPEVKTVSVKTEAPLEDRQAPLENQISVVNSCEKRSSEPASEHCETSSPDDDDNLPLFVLRKKLLQKNKTQLTDSQVDRDLDALSMAAQAKSMNFHLDSSQDSVISQDQCQIQRKVKGTARSPHIDSSSSDTDISSDHIITISDSEDEESPNIATIKSEKTSPRGLCPSTSTSEFSKQIAEARIKSEPPPSLTCDDYDSQLFEFETEDEVYSVWQDPYDDQKKPVVASSHSETSAELPISDPADTDMNNEFNEWGYDTDYISDDVLEKAAEAAEEMLTDSKQGNGLQKKNESVGSEGNLSVKCVHSSSFYRKDTPVTTAKHGEKTNIYSPKEASPLPSKVVHGKKTEAVVAQKVKSKSKELKRTKSPLKSGGKNVRRESLIRTSPAVIPPKKIRTGPDPSSTVEKLGFKKAPRKAFDLSQRSLDSLAELRNHGKMAGVVEPKRTKTKLISPQSLMVKCNKQMLACQDRQFYLQSRPKIDGKRKQAEASEGRSRKPENSSHKVDKNGNSGHFQATSSHAEVGSSTPRDDRKLSNNKECLEMSRTSANMSTAQNVEVPLSSKVENSSSHLLEQSVFSLSGDNAPTDDKESNYDEDDNDLFLTQMDPVDMEICSQVEYDIAIGDLEKGDTPQISNFSGSDAEMAKFATGIGTELPKMDDGLPMCKYRDCPEMVKDAGDHCPKHTPPEKVDDHLFAKPGLPPSLQKLSKPSTTKVFVLSNTSRTASLTKDIENLRQPQNATKAPIPKLPKPLTAQNRALDANSVLKPLNNQSNMPSKPSYTAVPEAGKSSPYTSQKPLQQRDQGWLMRELLRWTFEMFDNVSQFGPPSNLSQLPLVKVPLKFSSYEEYFNVYFPLMLLNTFESLAQDWSVKQQAINTHMCKLHLQTFCPDAQVNRGEFLAWFRDTDLCVQRHPKEDDLVFLCLPESGEEAQSHGAMVYHTGYVSRFNRSQKTVNQEKEQYTLCDLCIQTKGNLSAFRNQQVRCFVIGSLITTQRQFRALLQLQRNPLFRPIIMPNPTDFFPRDNVASETSSFPSLKEYNSDQKYAIERAYVMVKQQPRLPRICLIHGPPGTGKSKTIVGLLYRILMEKDSSSTVPVQNLNAKNKRNRVLVCAPSNAALDDLMKKIILEFKEKCYNKNNPLGNCGDINLVRLGAEKTISNDVVKFSLDCQVNHRITRAQQDQGLHKQKEMLDKKLDELSRRRALEKCNKNTQCAPLDEEIARLSKERQLLANSLKEVRRRPQELQRTIILESHIICCTLSTSGGILLESAFRQLGQEPFSCVIVDEASQSCEVETLIPLLHRCSKLVLVGDPEQLPPTVISMKAEDLGYGQSLMSRMCRFLESTGTKSPVLQLTMQYRMHPDICLFPSHYFYKRMLKTDRATEEVRCSSDWPFQPYMVFDVADGYERKERESFCNPQEIKVAVALIKLIKSRKKDFCFRNIGVITPYRAQKMRIIEELKRAFANDIKPGEVDTVDGFQGRQKDCIIVTCVRANSTQGSIGFLASRQRLNVTITRAKFSLFILGSLRTLMENKDWNHLIQDAQRRGALIKTKEEHYQRDVNRILKLKPVVQRAPLNPSSRPEEKHKDNAATSPRIETPVEITQPPRKPLCPPSRPVIHPAVDCRRDSFKTRNAPSGSTVGTLPHAQRSKLQDPRLARPPPTSNSAQNSTHSSRPSSSVAGSSHPARRDSRTVSDGSRSSNSWNRDWDRGRKRTSELEQDPKKRKLSR